MSKAILPIIARLKTNSTIQTNTEYTEGGVTYYRIFGGTRPQQIQTLSCMIVSEISEMGFEELSSTTSATQSKIEIISMGSSYQNSKTLANAARTVLENASYTTSSITVSKARLTASTDTVYQEKGGQSTPTFGVVQIYNVLLSSAV
ncbi:MAG TPA: hypothetical protein DF712_20780 [Balneola sp.]|nr:hypothetical protein [Balneola sp.]